MDNGKINEQRRDSEEIAKRKMRAAAVLAMHRIIDAGIKLADHQIAELEGYAFESETIGKWARSMVQYHHNIIGWLSHLRTTHWPVVEIIEAMKIHGVTGE